MGDYYIAVCSYRTRGVCLTNGNQVNRGLEQMRTLKTEAAGFLQNVDGVQKINIYISQSGQYYLLMKAFVASEHVSALCGQYATCYMQHHHLLVFLNALMY